MSAAIPIPKPCPPPSAPLRLLEPVRAPRMPIVRDATVQLTYWNHRCAHCTTWVPNHLRNCAHHERNPR